LFFEASEPSFDEVPFSRFKKRFPEGRYTFRGRTVEGRRLAGADRLSHLIPARPNITFPADGAEVDPNGFTVTWEPVTRPAGVDIATYVVTVVQGDRELNMDVPGSETSATIPGQFLEPGTRSELEVLSREKSGNQTITALEFRTR
jgi:Fibronectin type III domain